MLLARFVLFATGVIFAVYGAYCLYNPGFLASTLLPGGEPSPALQSELRAMYGGLQLAFGLILLGFLPKLRLRWGLWILVLTFLGLAAARTVGVVLDGGGSDDYVKSVLIYEWGTLILALLSLLLLPRITASS